MEDPTEGDERRAIRPHVLGVVQGGGFRYFAADRAARNGVDGWIRNLADGSVEIWAEGDEVAIERFVGDVRRGPPGARVTRMERQAVEPTGELRGFEIVRLLD